MFKWRLRMRVTNKGGEKMIQTLDTYNCAFLLWVGHLKLSCSVLKDVLLFKSKVDLVLVYNKSMQCVEYIGRFQCNGISTVYYTLL